MSQRERTHLIVVSGLTTDLFGRWFRYIEPAPERSRESLLKVGLAHINAVSTPRPAFREMADTLRWEEIR